MKRDLVARKAFADTFTIPRSADGERTARPASTRVQFAHVPARRHRIPLHPKHDAVGVQGVVDAKPREELRIPGTRRRRRRAMSRARSPARPVPTGTSTCRRSPRTAQSGHQTCRSPVDVAQVGAYRLFLRGSDAKEVHVGRTRGLFVVRVKRSRRASGCRAGPFESWLVEGMSPDANLGSCRGRMSTRRLVAQFSHPGACVAPR